MRQTGRVQPIVCQSERYSHLLQRKYRDDRVGNPPYHCQWGSVSLYGVMLMEIWYSVPIHMRDGLKGCMGSYRGPLLALALVMNYPRQIYIGYTEVI